MQFNKNNNRELHNPNLQKALDKAQKEKEIGISVRIPVSLKLKFDQKLQKDKAEITINNKYKTDNTPTMKSFLMGCMKSYVDDRLRIQDLT